MTISGMGLGSRQHRHPNQVGDYDFELPHDPNRDAWLQGYIRTRLPEQKTR